jgi:NitT/TauT family transport system substrate-binding protein
MSFLKTAGLSLALFISFSLPANAAEKIDKLVLSGPFAGVSNPLIHMVETGALNDIAEKVEFRAWNGPDQLRLMALDKGDFKADFIAMPSNVAANLYNRGVELKLMNISIWGILWMVSRDDSLKTIADFKGKEIAMPFRADMPDILFEQIALAEGLDPKKDFKLRYTPHPLDAMQLLILRQVDHALLAEPAISMALQKTKTFPVKIIAPELFRSVDLQKEWGRVFKREAKIPQAGMTAMKSVLNNPHALKRFQEEYKKSAQWCLDNPKEAGVMVAKHIDLLTPEAVEESLRWTIIEVKDGKESREELEFFYQKLMDGTPASVGGKLPDDRFYYKTPVM